MKQITLKENVLTDNILLIPDKGKVFKGGYIAIIKEYQYQNAWSDKEIVKKFKGTETLIKYLKKNYQHIDINLLDNLKKIPYLRITFKR